jgi:thiol-disulfide isomerase/thioredoxin
MRVRLWLVLLGVAILVGCSKERKPYTPEVRPAPANPLRGIHVGNIAREIEGVDVDGEHFKLSDYRGKVVVLDFWGNWCPPCVSMYPHNRLLVKKYQNQPFAFLGVNSGNTKEELKALRDEGKITWRVWLDEPKGRHDVEWRVDSYPRIFVIDGQGIIREEVHGAMPGEELEAIVDSLLKEMEPPKTKS